MKKTVSLVSAKRDRHLMKTGILLALFIILCQCAGARIIKGKIKDIQTGEDIIGASVILKGT